MRKILLLASLCCVACCTTIEPTQQQEQEGKVKNIIYMIGDGMGLAHVSMLQIEGGYEPTVFDQADNVALITTYSANNRVTDSAAAGTALACGYKTNNSMIGVTPDSVEVRSIMEKAHDKNFATGIAVTCYIQHATPASFYAHLMDRDDKKKANEDFIASGVDVAFGGGRVYFERFDKDYVQTLTNAGYNVLLDEAQLATAEGDKVVGLFADRSMNKILEGRGDYLANATAKALELLDKNVKNNSREGFVLMVEGSKIDFRTHDHETEAILAEMRDFEKAIKVAKEYADKNPGTLVVVCADHETAGTTIVSNESDFRLSESGIEYKYSTLGHSGVMVPVYLYGAGAEAINGVMDNTELSWKLQELIGVKE